MKAIPMSGAGLSACLSAVKTFVVLLVALSASGNSVCAQNARDFINLFNTIVRAAVIERVKAEWSKVPENQLACLEQRLQQQGDSTRNLMERGIMPQDPILSGLRAACRPLTVALPPPKETPEPQESISVRPTFDCARGKTSTARIICLDEEGAKADWDLISAYSARRFSLSENARQRFVDAHENWFPSLRRACGLRESQTTFSSNQRQCVLDAYRKRAELYRAKLSGDALAESRLSAGQRAAIQRALISHNYLDDDADGLFGVETRAAIKRFQARSGYPDTGFLTSEQTELTLAR